MASHGGSGSAAAAVDAEVNVIDLTSNGHGTDGNGHVASRAPQVAPSRRSVDAGVSTRKSSGKIVEGMLNSQTHFDHRAITLQKILDRDDTVQTLCSLMNDRTSESGFWVDSNQFKIFICVVIVFNAIFVGLTAVEEQPEDESSWDAKAIVFFVFECLFFGVFTTELSLRLRARGLATIVKDLWNWFDFLLVFANAIEVVMAFLQVLRVGSLTTAAAVLRVTRVMRLMRVFQIVRLFRFVDELHLLLKGMMSAMRTLVWSMGMLLTVIYICALLLTKYLGQTSDDELTKYYFGTLPRSMFTLFTFVTLEGWPDTARHLMDHEAWGPPLVVVIILFILFTNLALLNLVTAVLVESVVGISNADDKKRLERQNKERSEAVKRLHRIFEQMDYDGDGKLTLVEFKEGVAKNKEVQEMMDALQIAETDAEELFNIIDLDDDGGLTAIEFIDGALMCKTGDQTSRNLLGLHYDMRKYFTVLGCELDNMVQLLSSGVVDPDASASIAMMRQRTRSTNAIRRMSLYNGATAGCRSTTSEGLVFVNNSEASEDQKDGADPRLPKASLNRRTSSQTPRINEDAVKHIGPDAAAALRTDGSDSSAVEAAVARALQAVLAPRLEARLAGQLESLERRQREAIEAMETRLAAALQCAGSQSAAAQPGATPPSAAPPTSLAAPAPAPPSETTPLLGGPPPPPSQAPPSSPARPLPCGLAQLARAERGFAPAGASDDWALPSQPAHPSLPTGATLPPPTSLASPSSGSAAGSPLHSAVNGAFAPTSPAELVPKELVPKGSLPPVAVAAPQPQAAGICEAAWGPPKEGADTTGGPLVAVPASQTGGRLDGSHVVSIQLRARRYIS